MAEEKYIKLADLKNPFDGKTKKAYTAWEIAESLIIRCERCRWYDDREKMCYYHAKPTNYFDFCSRGREINVEID